MDDLDRLKEELFKDPEFKAEYDTLEPEYTLIEQLITARAEKIGTKQSSIARLESGNYNPSFQFLQKVARALGKRLSVSFV